MDDKAYAGMQTATGKGAWRRRRQMLRLPIVGALSLGAALSTSFATRTSADQLAPGEDQQFGQVRLLDASDAPLGNTPITVAVIPRRPDTWGAHPYPQVGTGHTDTTGHLHVKLGPVPTNDPAFSAPNGVINLEAYALDSYGQPVPVIDMAKYFGPDGNLGQEIRDASAQYPDIHLDAHAVQAIHHGMHLRRTSVAAQTALLQGVSHRRNGASGCSYSWWDNATTDALTVVGEMHTRYWAATGQFAYETQATSNIEVGISYDGGGTWGGNGTVGVTNTISQGTDWPMHSVNYGRQLKLSFHYQKQQWGSAACGMTNQYKVFALYWNGGSFTEGNDTSQYDGQYYVPNAQPVVSGQHYWRPQNTAVNYSGGVNVFGASLHAQSGYSGSVRLDLFARTDSGGYGCLYGSGNASPATAGIIYAGPYGSGGC